MSTVRISAARSINGQSGLFTEVALRQFERRSAQAALIAAERIVDSIFSISRIAHHAGAALLAVSAAVAELSIGAAERVAQVLIGWVDVTLQRHGRHG
jgi:hypothetical protein